jgi:hypothetical protein
MITLWQPWAAFMAMGIKQYETRYWATNYRGAIGVHAAKKWNQELNRLLDSLMIEYLVAAGYDRIDLEFGAILSAHRLIDCHPVERIRDNLSPLELALGDYSDGRFAWEMPLIKCPAKPIKAQGKQGLWNWEPEGEAE